MALMDQYANVFQLANRDVLKDPNVIKVGQELQIPAP